MKYMKKIVILIIIAAILLFGTLWYVLNYTNAPFAEMYRQDRCLDNGGKWNFENNNCLGGKYGTK